MTTIEQRVNDIAISDIKQIDAVTYEVTSQNPKNQKEVIWMVFNSLNIGWNCTCPSYLYSKTPENPTCKHIIRVQKAIESGELPKAQKEKVDLGDVFN